MRTKKIAVALLALGALLIPASQAMAAPAPAWQLSLIPMPTNFKPGTTGATGGGEKFPPRYRLLATNIGGAVTSGPLTLIVTLPPGLAPVPTPVGDLEALGAGCEIVGQTVECEVSVPVHPGRTLGLSVPVKVTGAPGPLAPAQASVEGGGAAPVATAVPAEIGSEPPPFGFLPGSAGMGTLLTNADGSPTTQAGSHPDQLTVSLAFPTEQPTAKLGARAAGHLRDLVTDLPRGMVVDPSATSRRCTQVQLVFNNGVNDDGGCPLASQVGNAVVMTEVAGESTIGVSNVFNMVSPPGVPAELAFEALPGIFVHIEGGVRSDGDYGLSGRGSDVLARATNPIFSTQVQLWGDPSASSHDKIRGQCREGEKFAVSCPVPPTEKTGLAFLTMPSECSGPISTAVEVDSWEQPGHFIRREAQSTDTEGNPVGVSGCNQEPFAPTISSKPTTNLTDSPSGLDFTLHQHQDQRLEHIAPANLKDATVTLPEGLVVNPSQADGLEACSESQIGYLGGGHYSKNPDSCPDAAKVGSLEVSTPLLDHKLPGSVYIAKPFDNQFGSLLAIYLVIDDPATGTIAKLAGRVIPDPVTGQLTTRFEENPELPLEDVKLHLFSGARASLITPQACGTHTTTSDLTPWSSPEGVNANPSDSFATTAFPGGGSCPSSDAGAPNSPAFSAGTILPQAGAYTPSS